MLVEKESQYKKRLIPDRRFTKHLDGITGATKLRPVVLEVMDKFRIGGVEELTDSQIQIDLKINYPKSPSRITTVLRALDGLETDGLITRRHVFATEASATKTCTGPRYRKLDNRKTPTDSLSGTKRQVR